MTHVGREQEIPALTIRPARTPAAAIAVWTGLVALAAAVLFFCYWRQSQAVPLSSDGSSNVLQAWAMLHGNLLLHNWWVSDVSFYTTELPQYHADRGADQARSLGGARRRGHDLYPARAARRAPRQGPRPGWRRVGARPAGRGPDAVAAARCHLDP